MTRQPIPSGAVSTIRGYWQAPALRTATWLIFALSLVASMLGGDAGQALTRVAVGVTIATPLLRLSWLLWRWWQERDLRFVMLGALVLLTVAVGAILAAA